VQPETKLHGANSTTNQSAIEEFRYHATGHSAELSLYKDPVELSRLGFPLNNFTHCHAAAAAAAVSQFVFVTAADDRYIYSSMDAIARIQTFFPHRSIYFYDLSDGVLVDKVDKVATVSHD